MERKNNIKMNKLFISCLSIFALCSAGYSQTYIYDKNLRASKNLITEARFVTTYKIYSSDEIISEFKANQIRADNLFKKKLIIIKGKIDSISKIDNDNYIRFDISENEYQKKYLYVLIYDTNSFKPVHSFDKITNYSVGDWVNIVGLYGGLDSNGYRVFTGSILHAQEINNPKKNFLIKIINVPEEFTVNYDNEDSIWATKFSEVVNGKTFCKIFNIYEKTMINLTFKDKDGNVIKNKKVTAKVNCQSIFDYNKL
jgi:hypothetical protein